MNAYMMNQKLQMRMELAGIVATNAQAGVLRRAELTLKSWAEAECGSSRDRSSRYIERDETTGKPYVVVHYHDENKSRRYSTPDREKGALARVAKLCKELGCYYYHQGDPRGCALYVGKEPLPANNYTQGHVNAGGA